MKFTYLLLKSREELAPLMKYKQVDLGIDNLDDDAPLHIRRALANATLSSDFTVNQLDLSTVSYFLFLFKKIFLDLLESSLKNSVKQGLPRFVKAVAQFYSPLIGRELVPGENVFATVGATGAVYDTFQGHTSPGDEWVVIQPAYTMYLPMIKLAHGVPRFTNLKLVSISTLFARSSLVQRITTLTCLIYQIII